MLKKFFAFGLVAFAILIAPTVANADDQEQYNQQTTEQNGAAINGSTNVQTSDTRSYQEQIQINGRRSDYYRPNRHRDHYYRRDYDRDDYYRRDHDRDDDYYYYHR